MSDNPSFVLRGIEDVIYEDRPIPDIEDHEVLVEVKKTGICGSDVHYLVAGRIADFVVESPMVLGHESSGVISKIGAKVSHLKIGDRVAMEPGATCHLCDSCKSGRYELCPNIVFAATPPYHGTLARYYSIPGDVAYLLPENLTLEDGAMVGDRAFGSCCIVAVDIVLSRLDFAKSYAATETFVPPKPEPNEGRMDYSRRSATVMKKQLGIEDRGQKAIDIVVDASGAEVSIQTAMFIVKTGGTYVQVGMGSAEVQVPITLLLTKEINLKGSFRYGPGDYPLAIALVAQGKVDLKPLITHRFPFTDAIKAFNTTRLGKSEDGKGVIKAVISGPDVSVDDY